MIVRDLQGATLNIDTTEKTTVSELKSKIQQILGITNESMVIVANGRCLGDHEYLNSFPTVILAKQLIQKTTSTPSQNLPDEPSQVCENEPPYIRSYIRSYSGEEVREAIKLSPYVIINLLSLLAKNDPFILSYVATNPNLVIQDINHMLTDPEFILTINAPTEEADPIAFILDLDQNNNHYGADRQAVQRIMDILDWTEDRFDYIKDLYLFFNRDETAVISHVKS